MLLIMIWVSTRFKPAAVPSLLAPCLLAAESMPRSKRDRARRASLRALHAADSDEDEHGLKRAKHVVFEKRAPAATQPMALHAPPPKKRVREAVAEASSSSSRPAKKADMRVLHPSKYGRTNYSNHNQQVVYVQVTDPLELHLDVPAVFKELMAAAVAHPPLFSLTPRDSFPYDPERLLPDERTGVVRDEAHVRHTFLHLLDRLAKVLVPVCHLRDAKHRMVDVHGHNCFVYPLVRRGSLDSLCMEVGVERLPKWCFVKGDGHVVVCLGNQGSHTFMTYAHQVVCWAFHGPAPCGHSMVIHVCENPRCLNPFHLQHGTPKQNARSRRGPHSPHGSSRRRFRGGGGEIDGVVVVADDA